MMRKYDDEFKQNAVKKILDGQSAASLSRELGVAESLLHKWKKIKISSASNAEREVIELRKRLREVRAAKSGRGFQAGCSAGADSAIQL